MKAVVLYHPNSEHARVVEEYVRDFERQHGSPIELVSLNTREGANMADLYGVMQYPALLVIQEDGQLLKIWQGEQLPLMNEVAAYIEPELRAKD